MGQVSVKERYPLGCKLGYSALMEVIFSPRSRIEPSEERRTCLVWRSLGCLLWVWRWEPYAVRWKQSVGVDLWAGMMK